MEQSKLVVTKEDLVKINNVLSNTDVIEACTKKRANRKWKFYKLSNDTIFAVLFTEVPVGCKDAILPESLTKKPHCQFPNLRREYKKTVQGQFMARETLALLSHENGGLHEKT